MVSTQRRWQAGLSPAAVQFLAAETRWSFNAARSKPGFRKCCPLEVSPRLFLHIRGAKPVAATFIAFLLPPGEGGAKCRMRVGSFIAVDTSPDPHPNPSPGGRGA